MLVQDLAEDLNVTRSEIYNILRRKRFAPLVKKNGSQIIIDNELSELLKEELEKKKQLTPKEIKDIKKETTEIQHEVSVTIDEDFLYQNTINILQSQIEFKDKQISILNTVIENNLKIIRQLEERQSSYKNLHEEIELLKNTLLDLTKRKNKKRFSMF
ncbi:hypothetical protein WHY64_15925 (plasmid) [Clostridium perfringens]|uniref:hypothetical protein n=1 Tax=Clostridium perfringens TaxID=1502 RepID=UPI0030CBA94F